MTTPPPAPTRRILGRGWFTFEQGSPSRAPRIRPTAPARTATPPTPPAPSPAPSSVASAAGTSTATPPSPPAPPPAPEPAAKNNKKRKRKWTYAYKPYKPSRQGTTRGTGPMTGAARAARAPYSHVQLPSNVAAPQSAPRRVLRPRRGGKVSGKLADGKQCQLP